MLLSNVMHRTVIMVVKGKGDPAGSGGGTCGSGGSGGRHGGSSGGGSAGGGADFDGTGGPVTAVLV